jgi:hypothetical protein
MVMRNQVMMDFLNYTFFPSNVCPTEYLFSQQFTNSAALKATTTTTTSATTIMLLI